MKAKRKTKRRTPKTNGKRKHWRTEKALMLERVSKATRGLRARAADVETHAYLKPPSLENAVAILVQALRAEIRRG